MEGWSESEEQWREGGPKKREVNGRRRQRGRGFGTFGFP